MKPELQDTLGLAVFKANADYLCITTKWSDLDASSRELYRKEGIAAVEAFISQIQGPVSTIIESIHGWPDSEIKQNTLLLLDLVKQAVEPEISLPQVEV